MCPSAFYPSTNPQQYLILKPHSSSRTENHLHQSTHTHTHTQTPPETKFWGIDVPDMLIPRAADWRVWLPSSEQSQHTFTSVINSKAFFFNCLCSLAVKEHDLSSPCPIIFTVISSEIHLSTFIHKQAVSKTQ